MNHALKMLNLVQKVLKYLNMHLMGLKLILNFNSKKVFMLIKFINLIKLILNYRIIYF